MDVPDAVFIFEGGGAVDSSSPVDQLPIQAPPLLTTLIKLRDLILKSDHVCLMLIVQAFGTLLSSGK